LRFFFCFAYSIPLLIPSRRFLADHRGDPAGS
jgi:hypothetical protein